MTGRAVCLIGPGHVASNPRLVKEADALHAAGFRVRVVSGTSHPLVEPLDQALLASRPWRAVRVPLGSKWDRVPRVARQRVSAGLVRRVGTNLNQAVARLNATGQRGEDLFPATQICVRAIRRLDEAAEQVRRSIP